MSSTDFWLVTNSDFHGSYCECQFGSSSESSRIRLSHFPPADGREVSDEDQILIDLLRIELSHPESSLETGENLCVTLFSMVTKFCSGAAPHFPMKKVLLVLWKIILFKLGGDIDDIDGSVYLSYRVNLCL